MSEASDKKERVHPATGEPLKRAMDYAAGGDWTGYYAAIGGTAPRETLLFALDRFDAESDSGSVAATGSDLVRMAIDLGCGEGKDVVPMLGRGWHVLAIDAEAEAFDLLLPRVDAADRSRLECRVEEFAEANLPGADLVNASFALPFCHPKHFDSVWEAIVGAIHPGGRFAGQFFGVNDSWASKPDRTHHTEEQVRHMLEPFEIEKLDIEEKDSAATRDGPSKHWHVFHVVARKPAH